MPRLALALLFALALLHILPSGSSANSGSLASPEIVAQPSAEGLYMRSMRRRTHYRRGSIPVTSRSFGARTGGGQSFFYCANPPCRRPR